jgi:hypothetical protein
MVTVRCPTCGTSARVPDHFEGKHIRCPQCSEDLRAPPAGNTRATREPAAPPERRPPVDAPPKTDRPSEPGLVTPAVARVVWFLAGGWAAFLLLIYVAALVSRDKKEGLEQIVQMIALLPTLLPVWVIAYAIDRLSRADEPPVPASGVDPDARR